MVFHHPDDMDLSLGLGEPVAEAGIREFQRKRKSDVPFV
jgi:hypothetical protein